MAQDSKGGAGSEGSDRQQIVFHEKLENTGYNYENDGKHPETLLAFHSFKI